MVKEERMKERKEERRREEESERENQKRESTLFTWSLLLRIRRKQK